MHDDVYQMYLEEVKRIPACSPKEEQELLQRVKAGDRGARERLLEGTLHFVIELAGRYRNRGLGAGDLVQEANMALLLALDVYEEGDFREQVKALAAEGWRQPLRHSRGKSRQRRRLRRGSMC